MSSPEKKKQWSFAPGSFVLILGLVFIVGYAAGTRNDQIVAAVAPIAGFKVETGSLDLSSVQNTFRTLKANFDGQLDDQKLIEGASRGLAAATGDGHTQYFDSKEARQFNNDLNGNIGGGIGASIGMREEKPTILNVLAGTPAEKEGLKNGDIVLAVNDQAVGKQTVDEVVGKIRGEIGTTVKLTVNRDGEAKIFNLTRQEITSPSVTSKLDGDIGILTITRFDKETGVSARAEAQKLKDQGAKKLVVDLRDNGGGTLPAAPDVAGLWLDNKVVVSERHEDKVVDEQRSGNNAILAGMPTVLLVNGGTASAAEIVAGALKDYKVATLIGQKTYGKGTVQQAIELNGGAMLKVTVQRWYTPNGTNVDKKGITPDQTVELTREDNNANRDPQLDAAKTFLRK